jgi:hypothetical protein
MPGVTPRSGHTNARDCSGILVQRLAKPGILVIAVCTQSIPLAAPYELEQRSVVELQDKLREIGQQTSGNKQTLIGRVAEVTDAPDKPPIWLGVQNLYARPRDYEKTLKRHKDRFNAEQEKSDQIADEMEPSTERLAARPFARWQRKTSFKSNIGASSAYCIGPIGISRG